MPGHTCWWSSHWKVKGHVYTIYSANPITVDRGLCKGICKGKSLAPPQHAKSAQTSQFGNVAYLAIINVCFAVSAHSLAKLACCQVALPLSKRTTPGTLSLMELALDNKFGYLLPHKLVRIVVLKSRMEREADQPGISSTKTRAHSSSTECQAENTMYVGTQ